MVDLLQQMLDPRIPWQRVRYARDIGFALAINFVQVITVVLIVRSALRLVESILQGFV